MFARLKVVQAMLERGSDPNAIDEQGWSPLHIAVIALARRSSYPGGLESARMTSILFP